MAHTSVLFGANVSIRILLLLLCRKCLSTHGTQLRWNDCSASLGNWLDSCCINFATVVLVRLVTIGSGPIVMNVLPSTTQRSSLHVRLSERTKYEEEQNEAREIYRECYGCYDGNTGCSRRRLISTSRYPIGSCDLPSARCRYSLHQKSDKYEFSRQSHV